MTEVNIKIRNFFTAILLMMPFLILYILFTIYPLIEAIRLSFYRTTPYGDVFVGLSNYITIFQGKDPRLNYGLQNVLIYGFFNMANIMLALLTAWLLTTAIIGRWSKFTQTIILTPMVVSWVTLGFSWNTIYSAMINLAKYFGFGTNWVHPHTLESTAKWSVGLLILWGSLGYATMLLISTLNSVPRDYFEAAMVDGASNWTIFKSITLPLIRNIIVFQLIGGISAAFNIFDPIAVLTGGGPAWTSTSVAFYAARQVQYAWNVGMSATIGVVTIMITLVLSILQFRLIYKRMV